MDFRFSEEQDMLSKFVRDFCVNEAPLTLVKQISKGLIEYPMELWGKMAELGWMGLALPEKYGGNGGSFMDLGVVLEEMGHACLPGPFFSTVVVGGSLIEDAGSDHQKDDLLPALIKGDLIISLALLEEKGITDPGDIKLKAAADKDNYVLNGKKLFVDNAHLANNFIVVARTGDGTKDISLFLVDAKAQGVSVKRVDTVSGIDKVGEVTFSQVSVPAENIIGTINKGWAPLQSVLQKATAAKSLEILGAAQQILDMTVSYAKDRVQGGHPIGSLQAIQHHIANMAMDVDGCRFIAYQAAWMVSQGKPCDREVAMAKVWAGDAFRRVIVLGHQVHGAIGYSEDHDLHLYTKRSRSFETAFGDSNFHRELVAQQIGM